MQADRWNSWALRLGKAEDRAMAGDKNALDKGVPGLARGRQTGAGNVGIWAKIRAVKNAWKFAWKFCAEFRHMVSNKKTSNFFTEISRKFHTNSTEFFTVVFTGARAGVFHPDNAKYHDSRALFGVWGVVVSRDRKRSHACAPRFPHSLRPSGLLLMPPTGSRNCLIDANTHLHESAKMSKFVGFVCDPSDVCP